MLLRGAGQLKQMNSFLLVVNDHNVRLLSSHTKLRGDRAPSIGCMSWQVTENCKFTIHRVHNIADDTVVSPGITVCV